MQSAGGKSTRAHDIGGGDVKSGPSDDLRALPFGACSPDGSRSRAAEIAAKSRLAKAARFSTIPCNLPLTNPRQVRGEGPWPKFWSSTMTLPCK